MGLPEISFEVTRTVAPVRQQILDSLRRAIVEGRFRPAERLVERELCALTGASRGSVREALRQLEAEQLIVTLPDRGPVVRAITPAEAKDLYEVRGLLEAMAGKLFATRATDDEIERLRETVGELRRAVTSDDPAASLGAKDRFYDILLEGCGSSNVRALVRSLHNRLALVRATNLSRPRRAVDTLPDLDRIVAAIARRDGDATWQAFVDHIANAAAVTLRLLDEQVAEREPSPVA